MKRGRITNYDTQLLVNILYYLFEEYISALFTDFIKVTE